MIQVTVSDNGPGMPPDVMDRIFSPFFTTKPQGSGLGLAIVRKIVDAHDGRIDVSERAGGGHAVPGDAAGPRQHAAVRVIAVRSSQRGFELRRGVLWVGFW